MESWLESGLIINLQDILSWHYWNQCQISNFALKNFRFLFWFWFLWAVPCGSPLIEGKFIYCRSYLFPTPLLFSPALTFWTLKVEGVGGGFQPGLINSQRPRFQQTFLEKMSGATGAESLGVTFFSKATVRHEMSGNGFPSSLCALSLIDYHLWQRHSPVLYLCNSYNAVSSHWSQQCLPSTIFFFFECGCLCPWLCLFLEFMLGIVCHGFCLSLPHDKAFLWSGCDLWSQRFRGLQTHLMSWSVQFPPRRQKL